ESSEMQSRTRVALARLSDEQQGIIYLKFYLDMPNGVWLTEHVPAEFLMFPDEG
ncbi:MAG: hypothetical protein JWO87_547, partial [Phycisphaerales bacterium]|nr:hypothetical protein [Phycisphaerales bacterium]